MNLYAYAGNNPIAYDDPFGLVCPPPAVICPEDAAVAADAAAATIGGLRIVASASTGASVAAGAAVASLPLLVESDYGGQPNPMVRIQAQGGGLNESVMVVGGTQGQVSGTDALHGLAALSAKLTPKQQKDRARAMQRAARYIKSAAGSGGTFPPGASFTNGPNTDLRIDVNVLRGRALTPGGRTDATITP